MEKDGERVRVLICEACGYSEGGRSRPKGCSTASVDPAMQADYLPTTDKLRHTGKKGPENDSFPEGCNNR